jgi:hypothetical protein
MKPDQIRDDFGSDCLIGKLLVPNCRFKQPKNANDPGV